MNNINNMKYILLSFLLVSSAYAAPDIYSETRYFGQPIRNADGSIKRDPKVIREFKKIHPCPSTLLTAGACAGWAIDHVIPLACGGFDAVWNLQWLPDSIKSSNDPHAKDRYERKINALNPPLTNSCINVIIK